MIESFSISSPAEPAELEARIAALAVELQDSQAELIKARVDVAESLSGDTAQDVDGLLGIIVASLGVLTGQLKADPDSVGLAQDALASALRCADLAHQMLDLADRPPHYGRSPADSAVDTVEMAEGLAEGMGAIVLAVDDNAGVRRVVVRQLTALGYRTLEAEDGPAALMILNSEPVDLLFTDVVMPGGMSGFDLARLVLARWPRMRALITSGFPHLEPGDDSAVAGKLRRLIKPYRKADLAIALRDVLEAEPDDLRKP